MIITANLYIASKRAVNFKRPAFSSPLIVSYVTNIWSIPIYITYCRYIVGMFVENSWNLEFPGLASREYQYKTKHFHSLFDLPMTPNILEEVEA